MNHHQQKTILLREGDYSDAFGYGVVWGSGSDLVKTFVTPFTDVFKTALGKTKELGVKTRTLLNVTLSTILTTLVPVISRHYQSVFDEEKQKIREIRQEYADVYNRTNDALFSGDGAFLAFLAAPAAVIGSVAVNKSPKVAKEVLSIVTGGLSDDMFDTVVQSAKSADRWVGTFDPKHPTKTTRKSRDVRWDSSYSDLFGESLLREEKDKITPASILSSKKFLNKALSSPAAKKASTEATRIYRSTLASVTKSADKISAAKTLNDLAKLSPKIAQTIKTKSAELKKIPDQERQAAEASLLSGVKKASNDLCVKNLEKQVDAVLKAGIPADSAFVADYRKAINHIKSLKH